MLHNPRYHMISSEELHGRLLDSARNVFSVMADIALEECHEGPDERQVDWVTALVGFEGDYHGLVALHCPAPMAQRIAAGLLCVEGEVAQQDVYDAMGEVVNILSGDIKLYLDSGGKQVQLSTPSVFSGDRDFHYEFITVPETITCYMASGDERLLIGVQASRG